VTPAAADIEGDGRIRTGVPRRPDFPDIRRGGRVEPQGSSVFSSDAVSAAVAACRSGFRAKETAGSCEVLNLLEAIEALGVTAE